jgi:hypothetical protein
MDDALRERVEALERAVTDGEHDLSAVAAEADALERLDELEDSVTALEEQVEDLQAATQALRGYVGNVRSVNTDVEQRADAALAKVESLEQRLGDGAGSQRSQADDGAASRDHPARRTPERSTTDTDTAVAKSDSRRQSNPTQGARSATGETPADSHDDAAGRGAHTSGTDPANAHPTDGGVMTTETDHCASCGRPHDPEETTSTTHEDGLSGPADSRGRDGSWPTQPRGAADTAQATASTPVTADQDTTAPAEAPSTESVGGVEGVPTVESLARESPDTDDPVDESLPSGDADPLVGAAEGSGEAGALQRIRDLL